ncbi:MAG: SAM-dependent methyltransferase [Pseudomonadota bacterium]
MADIHILGLGIQTVDHATRETERILSTCTEVLFVDTGIATEQWLKTLCPRVTPLFGESYRPGSHRLSAYHHMAARVVEAAMQRPPVAFAMQGHPLVGVTAPRLIHQLANALELSVETHPGISSLDCLFVELGLDPMLGGLQIVEATDLLLRRRPLDPTVPALIAQIGAVESVLYNRRVSRPDRYRRFLAHMLQLYPQPHGVSALFTAPHPLVPSERLDFALGDIGAMAERLHPGHTLFVPPIADRPVVDLTLLEDMADPVHLRRITR